MFELRNPPPGWKADKLGREPRRKRKITNTSLTTLFSSFYNPLK